MSGMCVWKQDLASRVEEQVCLILIDVKMNVPALGDICPRLGDIRHWKIRAHPTKLYSVQGPNFRIPYTDLEEQEKVLALYFMRDKTRDYAGRPLHFHQFFQRPVT